MKITINTKYDINQKVYIIWNINTAIRDFIEGLDITNRIVETKVLSLLSIGIRNNKYIMHYKLDDVFYMTEEEDIFSSKEDASNFLMQKIKIALVSELKDLEEKNIKSLDEIYSDFKNKLDENNKETIEVQNKIKKIHDILNGII